MTRIRRGSRALGALACAALSLAPGRGLAQGPALASMRAGLSATPSVRTSKPDIEPARVTGEALAGAYAGIGGYVIGSWIGGVAGDALPTTSQETLDRISFTFGVAGATLATAGAVAAVGNIGDQTGSFAVTVVGAASGILAGVLLNQLIYGHARLPSGSESSRMRWLEASLEALLPSLGATIAFNSTRTYK